MFLLALALAYLFVRVWEDGSARIRNQTPPRHEYRMAKLAARDEGGAYAPTSAASRYITGLFDDVWNSAHERRELLADARAERRAHRAARKAKRMRAREERKNQELADELGGAQPQSEAPTGFDAVVPIPTDLNTADAFDPLTLEQAEQVQRAHGADNARRVREAEELAEGLLPGPTPEPDAADEPASPRLVEPVDDTDHQEEPPATTTSSTDPVPDNVIPFARISTAHPISTPERIPFPMTSTEVTGLSSAIAYAADLQTFCVQTQDQVSTIVPSDIAASCEKAQADLTAGGVSGQALTDIAAVQDQMAAAIADLHDALAQLELAGASAASLHQTLTSHLTVQEAYAANDGAGSREFVTAD